MTDQERIEMSKIVISDKTFKKTDHEKVELKIAKAKHKDFVRNNPSYSGAR